MSAPTYLAGAALTVAIGVALMVGAAAVRRRVLPSWPGPEVGRRGRHGAFAPIATCSVWRSAVNRGRYRYVVVSPRPSVVLGPVRGAESPPEAAWTRGAPGVTQILREGPVTVLRVGRPLDPRGCPRAAEAAATVPGRG